MWHQTHTRLGPGQIPRPSSAAQTDSLSCPQSPIPNLQARLQGLPCVEEGPWTWTPGPGPLPLLCPKLALPPASRLSHLHGRNRTTKARPPPHGTMRSDGAVLTLTQVLSKQRALARSRSYETEDPDSVSSSSVQAWCDLKQGRHPVFPPVLR